MNKQSVRSKYLECRNRLSKSERAEKSRKICDRLKQEPAFLEAEFVLVYMDYRSEVMTTALVEELLAQGKKRVFAPKVEGLDIFFYEIKSLEDLEDGYQNIREPKIRQEAFLTEEMLAEHKSFLFVPGSVFDRELHRMGYGKGFYDRFLHKHRGVIKAGLAFECQLAKQVPTEAHDIKMDMIITENQVIQ